LEGDLMRRWIGNHLIQLGFHIEPKLAVEHNAYVQQLITEQAQAAANHATHTLLQHQQHAARIAAMQ
jgi:ABC-type phosphate/phosphonate transport system substrate-binding protein